MIQPLTSSAETSAEAWEQLSSSYANSLRSKIIYLKAKLAKSPKEDKSVALGVKFMIIAGADNRPPMLEKSLYDSWKSRMELYIDNRENGRMILNSFQNGLLVWPIVVEEDGTTRTKKYEELSVVEKLQADCDLKATNIVLQGLPPDAYAIVIHHKVAKEI
ncbi:hypothetical protein Tco_0515510 [Tanacetum coccineum]